MDETFQTRLGVLADEVQAMALPSACKHTALWCLEQLPDLYAKFRQSNESRYGEEITRLVRAALKELEDSKATAPEAPTLAARMIDSLRLLHEEFGIPGLVFKTPTAPTRRPRKAG